MTRLIIPELTPFTPNKEVERILTEHHVKLQSAVGGSPYAVDYHYEVYVLHSINTLEDAFAMLDQLDAEHPPRGNYYGCTKASEARKWLEKDFWRETPSRIRVAIASNRRACCGVHESYSFAIDERKWI